MIRILIVDDEEKMARVLSSMLENQGYSVDTAASGERALEAIDKNLYDIVVTDLKMGEVGGMEVLSGAKSRSPNSEVIVMTAYAGVDSAIEAMRLGAHDYLVKPFSMEDFRAKIRKLAEQMQLFKRSEEQDARLRSEYSFSQVIGRSEAIGQVIALTKKVAPTEATVLIRGESGTGKELIARAIHFNSTRAAGPLVEVNCTAFPDTLLESELFGYEKGAFTGATRTKPGRFENAAGGTLFLDEIGDMHPQAQVKLLRVLQEKNFVRVGGRDSVPVNVRIVAATNRNLEEAMRDGHFREDLFYRLNVFPIYIPALRERKDDIAPLAEHFLSRRGIDPSLLAEETYNRMLAYNWPGNVRELQNAIERMVILATPGEPLTADLLPFAGKSAVAPPPGIEDDDEEGASLDEKEHRLILDAIEQAGGNKTKAAQILGITRRRLYSKLKSLEERHKNNK